MRNKFIGLLITVLFATTTMPVSNAIWGGKPSNGENFVVQILPKDTDSSTDLFFGCSGVLLTKRIVLTVAHCAVLPSGNLSKTIMVVKPGKEWIATNLALVEKIFLDPNFERGKSNTTAPDDIAYLYLDRDFDDPAVTRVATDFEIQDFITKNTEISAIGYGRSSANDTSSNRPGNLIYGKLIEKTPSMFRNTLTLKTISSGGCTGDSGGPVFRRSADGIVLVGLIIGGSSNTCGGSPSGEFSASIVIINKYGLLFDQVKAYALDQVNAVNAKTTLELKAEVENLKNNLLESEANYGRTSGELEDLKAKFDKCMKSAKLIIKSKKGKLAKGC